MPVAERAPRTNYALARDAFAILRTVHAGTQPTDELKRREQSGIIRWLESRGCDPAAAG